MVTQELVAPLRELGERATQALAADAKVKLGAASWWHDEETGQLRFLVATPLVETHGPRKAYLQIRRALARASLDDFPLHRVWAIGIHHPIVAKLREMHGTRTRDHLLYARFDADGFSADYLYLYWIK